jgi:hypothetical protein
VKAHLLLTYANKECSMCVYVCVCPSTGEWINKYKYLHKGYYLARKGNHMLNVDEP